MNKVPQGPPEWSENPKNDFSPRNHLCLSHLSHKNFLGVPHICWILVSPFLKFLLVFYVLFFQTGWILLRLESQWVSKRPSKYLPTDIPEAQHIRQQLYIRSRFCSQTTFNCLLILLFLQLTNLTKQPTTHLWLHLKTQVFSDDSTNDDRGGVFWQTKYF